MRITSKGQVTIPQEVREKTGLLPHTDVEFIIEQDGVRIVKVNHGKRPSRGQLAVEALQRAAAARNALTTDEIMAMTRGQE
jgi:AbrB family looped-hinge helix DNA binding protein